MTRSRSGSFYCPIEPAWAPLSLSQKAAISTAVPSNSSPNRPARRHVRNPSGDYEHFQSQPSSRAAGFLSTPELSKYGFGTNAVPPARKRHAHSPARPSLLCGQVVAPRCPSEIWTSSQQQHHRHHQRSRSSPTSSSTSSLHRSVLKSAFMSGPMARKARMYGLRVAWCVFGDARFEMAKDIFGRGGASAGILGAPVEAEVQYEETVEMPMHEMSFEWEADTSRSRSQPTSYLEIDQLESDSDDDSDSTLSEDSDYTSDEETEGAESDELDDADEIHRSVLAVFEQTALDSSPNEKHAQVTDDAHWEVLSFEA